MAVLTRIRSAVDVAKRVVAVAVDQEVTFLAASVAYYAFVSLIPTAVLALIVATTFGGQQFADVVLAASGQFLTGTGQDVLRQALTSSEGRTEATALGLVLLAWGTLKVFRGLDIAFSKVYGAEVENTFVDQLIDSAVVVVGIGLSMVLMFVVGGVLAAANLGVVVEAVSVIGLPIVLTVAFLPIYYRFPDRPVTVREVLPGAVFAALGWAVLQALFQLYATTASQNAYGVVGGVILLVTWLYIAGAVIMVGAVINVVLAPDKEPGREPETAPDRQYQGPRGRETEPMADEREPAGAPDVAELEDRIEELRADLDDFEDDVQSRTVERPRLEAELKHYVRKRMRQGHARGWGPYLVLLYGTVMTLGAFFWLGGWASVAAMLVIFTSTLGLYVLFVLFGGLWGAVGAAAGLVDSVRRGR